MCMAETNTTLLIGYTPIQNKKFKKKKKNCHKVGRGGIFIVDQVNVKVKKKKLEDKKANGREVSIEQIYRKRDTERGGKREDPRGHF